MFQLEKEYILNSEVDFNEAKADLDCFRDLVNSENPKEILKSILIEIWSYSNLEIKQKEDFIVEITLDNLGSYLDYNFITNKFSIKLNRNSDFIVNKYYKLKLIITAYCIKEYLEF